MKKLVVIKKHVLNGKILYIKKNGIKFSCQINGV